MKKVHPYNRRSFLKTMGVAGAGMFVYGCASTAAVTESSATLAVRPKRLVAGDKVGVIAPASAIFNEHAIDDFKQFLTGLGFEVVLGEAVYQQYGNLAGTDIARARDLNAMFSRPDIKGIFTMRGGWGSARILPLLDYAMIKKNPKFFMGYSDITALLNALYRQTGLVTFHGPVGYSAWNDFTVSHFKELVLENKPMILRSPESVADHIETITPGIAEGELVGGNLSVLTSMLGSRYLPDFNGKILFVEEINEEVYRIDRMLTELQLAGILGQINGFVFGKCKKCDPEDPEHSLTFQQLMDDHIKQLNIPSFSGALIGHIDNQFTIPIGAKARINSRLGTIEILEPPLI